MDLKIFTDGGSRGNPGHSGYGVVIYGEQGRTIAELSKYLGIRTNNEAEYSGLLDALQWLVANSAIHQVTSATFYSDSQLMVRQLNGQYKVKSSNIKPLYQQAISLISKLNFPVKFIDVLRDKNQRADELANLAMDRKI